MAVDPATRTIYVANRESGSVSVIDIASNTVTATIAVGEFPLAVAVSPTGTRVYVTSYTTDTVWVISSATNTVIDTFAVGAGPSGVAVAYI